MGSKKLGLTILAGAMLAAALFSSAKVSAGQRGTLPVTVGANFFQGSIGSARNSSDSVQFAACSLGSDSTSWWGWCNVTDASGNSRSCSTSADSMVKAIASMKSDAYISVYFDTAGNCTQIYNYNLSSMPPKMH
jgi:hypothetical protein